MFLLSVLILCTEISDAPNGPPAESGPFGPNTPRPSGGPRKCGGSSSSSSSLAEPINESVMIYKNKKKKMLHELMIRKSVVSIGVRNLNGKCVNVEITQKYYDALICYSL